MTDNENSPNDRRVSLKESERDMRVVETKRETARQIIAITASSSLLILVIFPFVDIIFLKEFTFDNLKEILHILIPPAIGIFGAVAGFYFGEKNMG